jgi:hypothetical protein
MKCAPGAHSFDSRTLLHTTLMLAAVVPAQPRSYPARYF